MNTTTALRTATQYLNHMLANLRVELLQTQDGRAFLDELPESHRRMLKHATTVL